MCISGFSASQQGVGTQDARKKHGSTQPRKAHLTGLGPGARAHKHTMDGTHQDKPTDQESAQRANYHPQSNTPRRACSRLWHRSFSPSAFTRTIRFILNETTFAVHHHRVWRGERLSQDTATVNQVITEIDVTNQTTVGHPAGTAHTPSDTSRDTHWPHPVPALPKDGLNMGGKAEFTGS